MLEVSPNFPLPDPVQKITNTATGTAKGTTAVWEMEKNPRYFKIMTNNYGAI